MDTRHGDFGGRRERAVTAPAREGLPSAPAGAGKIAKAARRAEAGARERESATPTAEPVRDQLITVCDGANFRTRPSQRCEGDAARLWGTTCQGEVRAVGAATDDRPPTTGGRRDGAMITHAVRRPGP
ncbi:hypothetical protein GCM10012285_61990 [Streptomyces kronopolitis]|uniref:Uncharacterized protein n=1 Tax=Streptomyces kronopolitis TaxID=1612435 RepID=A0ABQ2K2N1_9ACTN|nr:hypothetical protein GCM10012285_61990 [Streptomyces kronopolitis]